MTIAHSASSLPAPDAQDLPLAAPAVSTYDVVVVGAGTGGVMAAVQAARMGARVALIEETDWIGGQTTTSGVGTLDGGMAIRRSGLYHEFLEKARRFYRERGKSVGTCYWNPESVCVSPSVGQIIFAELIDETVARQLPDGTRPVLDLYLQTSVTAVIKAGNVVEGVQTADGAIFHSTIVIDATEYGDVLPLAGARYRVGNSSSDGVHANACIQDITYTATIRKYPRGVPPELQVNLPPPGYEQIRPSFQRMVTRDGSSWFVPTGISYPVNVDFHNGYRGVPDLSNPEDYTASRIDLPKITRTGVNWTNDYPGGVKAASSGPRLSVLYLEDPTARRTFACEAKLATLSFLYYLQYELGHPKWSVANDEGYDTTYNLQHNSDCPNIPRRYKSLEAHMPPRPYVRESRRLIGVRTLTAEDIQRSVDYARPAPMASAVAVGDYEIDLHNCNTDETLETALETRADISPGFGHLFQVPLESYIPESVDGLLVAEKNLSQTRLVNGATRMQPAAMIIGQAAGAIAATAVSRKLQPRHVKALWVQYALAKSGAIITTYPFGDVPDSHPFFPHIQVASTRGIVDGASAETFGMDHGGTRRMVARAIAKAFDLATEDLPATPTFADVPLSDPDFPYIEALHRAGMTAGCATSPNRFCPDRLVTRADMSILLIRALGLDPVSATTQPYFSDVPPTAYYFRHVQLMRQQGITFGCTPNTFCPDAGITRGQLAVFAIRAMLLVP